MLPGWLETPTLRASMIASSALRWMLRPSTAKVSRRGSKASTRPSGPVARASAMAWADERADVGHDTAGGDEAAQQVQLGLGPFAIPAERIGDDGVARQGFEDAMAPVDRGHVVCDVRNETSSGSAPEMPWTSWELRAVRTITSCSQ